MSSIIVVSGRSRGFIFHLDAATATVGRDESCDIQILDDLVSRQHLELRNQGGAGGTYTVVDMQSANGLYVNGAKTAEAALSDGTVVQIGTTKLLFTDRDFPDHDSALDYYKLRGQGEQQTFIAPPPADDEPGTG